MHVSLSSKLLGTPCHLSYDGSTYTWSNEIPGDSWLLGFDSPRDLSCVAEALGTELSTFESSPHGRSAREIFGDSDIIIPWHHIIPKDKFKTMLSELLGQLWMICTSQATSYYLNRFIRNREQLCSLRRPLINATLLSNIAKHEGLRRGEILKFSPDNDGYAKRTVYNLTKSSTGRLTVSSGPNILTLNKKYRNIIMSRFSDGEILQADIISLEPRIALAIAGKSIPNDIYEFVRVELLDSVVSRSEAKIIALSCIYGSSEWALSKQLPDGINSKDTRRRIRSYFNVDNLEKLLMSEYDRSGYITNVYGRRLDPGDAIVNRYLQSSGVDVSFEVFEEVNRQMSDLSDECLPIFIIHDAEIFDVSKRASTKLKEIVSKGIYVPTLSAKFPIKIEVIN